MKPKDDLTFGYVNSLLEYNPESGVLIWRVDRKKGFVTLKAGTIAGWLDSFGYHIIGVDGKLYKAHRLAWLLHTGRYPKDLIDHVNGDRSDNRIDNLREASRIENNQNRKKQVSKLGETGIYLTKCNTYNVQLADNGNGRKSYGNYPTLEEAIKVRDREEARIKGGFLPER